MIFQEPMTSMNPVITIGSQISESFIRPQNKSKINISDMLCHALTNGISIASANLIDCVSITYCNVSCIQLGDGTNSVYL
jgi:ABC-type dipeptide/oligopeptide/nickel transport system ATPase component